MGTDDSRLQEWQAARELLVNYDGLIHDIRKYGFSFITALLTAQAIIIPNIPSTASGNQLFVPEIVKAGIFAITLFLILGLAYFEKIYKLIQESAAERALILELNLNLELTEKIKEQFETYNIRNSEIVIYGLFVSGVIILSLFTINIIYAGLLFILSICIFIIIIRLKIIRKLPFMGDWSISKIKCRKGDIIEINVVNLSKMPIIFNVGEKIFEIKNVKTNNVNHYEIASSKISVPYYYSHTWIWDTRDVKTGIYRIYPFGNEFYLKRSIIVNE